MRIVRAPSTGELVSRIRDPELGHNIIDLGLVYDISIVGDAVCITMTTSCLATGFLKEGVANFLHVPGVGSVDIEMTFEPPWTPSRIEPSARASLGFGAIN